MVLKLSTLSDSDAFDSFKKVPVLSTKPETLVSYSFILTIAYSI